MKLLFVFYCYVEYIIISLFHVFILLMKVLSYIRSIFVLQFNYNIHNNYFFMIFLLNVINFKVIISYKNALCK